MYVIDGYLIITVKLKVLLKKINVTLILKMNRYSETLEYLKHNRYIEIEGVC